MIKLGVDVRGIRPEILLAIQEAREIFRLFKVNLVITSVLDGRHGGPSSLHHSGLAVDLRTRHLEKSDRPVVAKDLARILGRQYDVVLEKDHIHIEFDPKEK